MPKWGYSTIEIDPDTSVKASGREIRISHKAAREVCGAIRGMRLDAAKEFLEQVIQKRRAVPYRKYRKKIPHRRGLGETAAGRYPVKTAKKIMEVLESAESNALYRGLDSEALKVVHAAAYKGITRKRATPRAMGRSSPKNNTLCHVEIVLERTGGEI